MSRPRVALRPAAQSARRPPGSRQQTQFIEEAAHVANPQYVYHMSKLSKAYPGGKQVLKDISLSFFPGAKIGVVGLERRGQVDASQDHGRPDRRLHRRGVGGRRHQGRLPAAGARARSREGRARQRHGGRRREEGAGRPLQRACRQLLRGDGGGDGQAAGRDRRAGPVGPRHPGRAGAGRAALPAWRQSGRQSFRAARSGAWR